MNPESSYKAPQEYLEGDRPKIDIDADYYAEQYAQEMYPDSAPDSPERRAAFQQAYAEIVNNI